jgi:simple sugar transport system ATP-binding protein
VGILFVGEDLDVLMAFCDRIMVMPAGRVTGIVPAQGVTKDQLGLMMAGQTWCQTPMTPSKGDAV